MQLVTYVVPPARDVDVGVAPLEERGVAVPVPAAHAGVIAPVVVAVRERG